MKNNISRKGAKYATQRRKDFVQLGDFVYSWLKKISCEATKIISCIILVFTVTLIQAQNSPAKKPVAKPAAPAVQLKTLEDSANYAMGLSIANFYRQQGVTKINSTLVTKAINDAMSGKPTLLNDAQTSNVLMTYLNKQQMVKSKPNIDACNNFLTVNKTKQGVVTTASGLQYEVISQGAGPKPGLKDTVVCNYKGTFLDGKEFDNSYKRGEPAEFPLTNVIRGWTEVLQLMPVGSKYKVYVPYQLGYGPSDYNGIPGGSLLVFEIELLNVK
jgi:FKBP-type peptidyl-prolyl cis-trans isomerase FklB